MYTVKILKGELKEVENNFNRINEFDGGLRKTLADDKERYEHILKQNNEIEDNLAKVYTFLSPSIYFKS